MNDFSKLSAQIQEISESFRKGLSFKAKTNKQIKEVRWDDGICY